MATPGNGKTIAGSRLRPYLTTAQLISLAAFASPIISLLFVLFRLQLSGDAAQQSVNQAKDSLQASCLAAERAASVGASLPRYLAQGVNHQITDACVATMEGARIALTLSLTATEALIEFVIDMYRSTFLCLLELVIRGGLAVVIAAVTEATSFINNTLSTITSGIANDVQAANSAIQTAVNAVKSIIPFGLSNNINVPQFTVPSASQLANIQIPTTFEDQLKNLNNTIPTLQDLREKLDSLISIPFQLVKKEINDTFLASQASFVATPLPVPEAATVSFCGDTITSSFENLGNDLVKIASIGIYIVLASMVLLFIGYAFLTWYSQRSLRNNIERIRVLWFGEGTATTDRLMAFDAMISHPIWTVIVRFLAEKFRLSQDKYDALTWFGLYVFHPAPMACLLIGIFGLISVQLQLAIVGPLQSRYSGQISSDINGLTNTIALKLNDTMFQESATYAQTMNAKIDAVQTTINTDLFGWVNATIVPLNSTLASFYQEVQDTVTTVFGKTPFEPPAQEFVRCILGSKIIGIEKALTFLHNNLAVDLPRVNETALVLSQGNVNEVATPISAAAVGSGNNGEDGGVVGKIITRYISTLEKERITFFIFLLLWALVVVLALFIIAWHMWIVPAIHRRGGKVPRWLAGPSWENSPSVYNNEASSTEKAQFGTLEYGAPPTFVPIPSPLTKHPKSEARSTSAQIVDPDQLRQRKAGEVRMASDLDSYLDTRPEEQRPSLFQRLRGFNFGRKHVAKKNSDSAILPVAQPSRVSDHLNDEPNQDWFDKVTFWKRGGPNNLATEEPLAPPGGITVPHDRSASQASGFDYDVTPPRHPAAKRASNESRMNPGLTVDVAKASAASIRPKIVLESPDHRMETVSFPTPPNAPRTPRQAKQSRDPHHLAVPSTSTKHRGPPNPTPPAWVAAMKAKELPAIDRAPVRRSPSERDVVKWRKAELASNGWDAPRRPPGLGSDNGRSPAYPEPAVTSKSRAPSSRDRGDRRVERNHSIPPRSQRSRTPSEGRGDPRGKVPKKSSSFDDVDPFATPLRASKPLPPPMEPVKLRVTNLASNNPFATPFDDVNAVKAA